MSPHNNFIKCKFCALHNMSDSDRPFLIFYYVFIFCYYILFYIYIVLYFIMFIYFVLIFYYVVQSELNYRG